MEIRPRQIALFIALQCASLAIGTMKTLLDWNHLRSQSSVAFILWIFFFTTAIIVFLIWKISQGRNWARITLLVFFILGLLPFFFILRAELGRSTSLGLLSILQTGLQVYSLVLVFTTPANQWFRRPYVESPPTLTQE